MHARNLTLKLEKYGILEKPVLFYNLVSIIETFYLVASLQPRRDTL